MKSTDPMENFQNPYQSAQENAQDRGTMNEAYAREDLRMWALDRAFINCGVATAEEIIARAEAFLAFIRA